MRLVTLLMVQFDITSLERLLLLRVMQHTSLPGGLLTHLPGGPLALWCMAERDFSLVRVRGFRLIAL